MKDTEAFWRQIEAADKKNYAMCCSVFSAMDKDVENTAIKDAGLVDEHAYTLIGAKTIYLNERGSETEKLIKIRNPYGRVEWKGDWGDKSPKWTVHTREQVDCKDKEDGIFFISFSDFLKFFATTTICYYIDDCEDSYIADMHEYGSWAMAKFTLERDNPQPIFITLD